MALNPAARVRILSGGSINYKASITAQGSPGVQKTSFFYQNQKLFFAFIGFIDFFGFLVFNLKKEKIQYAYIVYCSAFINTKLL